MKKTLLIACAASALSLFAVSAQAADVTPVPESSGFYVSLFGGASFLNDIDAVQHYDSPDPDYDYTLDTKTGYILGGTIGMRVWDPLRAEVEVSYARWKADSYSGERDDGVDSKFSGDASGHVSATYLLGNLWYDIDTGTSFTPYVGGGAGVAWVSGNTEFDDDDLYGYDDGEMGFAFQAGAGVTFDLTENIALDVGYRFKGVLGIDFDAPDSDIEPYEHGDLYSHNVQAGVIFKF